MTEQNGSQEQSHAPDFKDAYDQAQSTGDFAFVIQTAKDSDKMLRDFKQAVLMASFGGRDSRAIAMGLQFLDNMIAQSAAQLENLKRTEKATREAIKAEQRNQKMAVVEPEAPGETPEPPASAPSNQPQDVTPIIPAEAPEQGWEPSNG